MTNLFKTTFTNLKWLSVLALVHAHGANSQTQDPQMALVYVKGSALVIDGAITVGLLDRIKSRFNQAVKEVVIRSPGGDVREGVQIGEFIRDHELDVKVRGYCNSSCANFIFTSGKRKIIGDEAILCFHGTNKSTMRSKEFEESVRHYFHTEKNEFDETQILADVARRREVEKPWIEREEKFFKSVGLDSEGIIANPSASDYVRGKFLCPSRAGFAKLGVKNIEGDIDDSKLPKGGFIYSGKSEAQIHQTFVNISTGAVQ